MSGRGSRPGCKGLPFPAAWLERPLQVPEPTSATAPGPAPSHGCPAQDKKPPRGLVPTMWPAMPVEPGGIPAGFGWGLQTGAPPPWLSGEGSGRTLESPKTGCTHSPEALRSALPTQRVGGKAGGGGCPVCHHDLGRRPPPWPGVSRGSGVTRRAPLSSAPTPAGDLQGQAEGGLQPAGRAPGELTG